jgi:hypothetical protein
LQRGYLPVTAKRVHVSAIRQRRYKLSRMRRPASPATRNFRVGKIFAKTILFPQILYSPPKFFTQKAEKVSLLQKASFCTRAETRR